MTFQSGPAMTSATSLSTLGSMEQNITTNSQKSCSKTPCTCSNSSWLLAPSFSMSFPLSDHKLQGRKLAELERHKKQPSRRMCCPPACIAGVISLYNIYSFSHVTPRQPTSLIFATSTLLLFWTVPFLVSQNLPLISSSFVYFPSPE